MNNKAKNTWWNYNIWKDPNISKADRILLVISMLVTLAMPFSVIFWLIILFVRKKIPTKSKVTLAIILIIGAIGAWMMWHDVFFL